MSICKKETSLFISSTCTRKRERACECTRSVCTTVVVFRQNTRATKLESRFRGPSHLVRSPRECKISMSDRPCGFRASLPPSRRAARYRHDVSVRHRANKILTVHQSLPDGVANSPGSRYDVEERRIVSRRPPGEQNEQKTGVEEAAHD